MMGVGRTIENSLFIIRVPLGCLAMPPRCDAHHFFPLVLVEVDSAM